MSDRSIRNGTELAWEIKLTDWSMAGNLSNRSSGVQIPRDICTRLKRYLYSAKCCWIISTGRLGLVLNYADKVAEFLNRFFYFVWKINFPLILYLVYHIPLLLVPCGTRSLQLQINILLPFFPRSATKVPAKKNCRKNFLWNYAYQHRKQNLLLPFISDLFCSEKRKETFRNERGLQKRIIRRYSVEKSIYN